MIWTNENNGDFLAYEIASEAMYTMHYVAYALCICLKQYRFDYFTTEIRL